MENKNIQISNQDKTLRSKYILAVGVTLFVIALVLGILNWQYEPDPASDYKIRQEASQYIGKLPNELTDEDFAKLTKFRLGTPEHILGAGAGPSVSQELSDINLLEKFINLNQLGLVSIHYPLIKIPKWVKILDKYGLYSIEKKYTLDLEPISKLHSLQNLTIILTPVKDIKPLAELENLQTLDLEVIQVSNLEPLRNLVNLRELFLNETSASNLEPIKGLTNLITLSISDTKVSSLEPIKGLVNLRTLYAYNTPISDLKPIMELKVLQELHIIGCNNITYQQIEELQEEMPHLKILYGNK